MKNPERWLHGELERWVDERVISPTQAEQLRQRYPTTAHERPSWGLIVFATAGALVVGLGVILLFAYNWDEIPKFGKLALIFGAMIGAHVAGIALLAKPDWRAQLGHAMAALGTMLYGAGIWLVAQIYHIDEHYPNGFMFWALGALAMAWAIRSIPVGLLAVVLVTIWGGCETIDFRTPAHWAMVAIVVGIVPLAWQRRSALLLVASGIALQILLLMDLAVWGAASHMFTASLAFGATLVALGRLAHATFPTGARGLEVLGYAAFLVCAYLLSFKGAARSLLDWTSGQEWRPAHAAATAWTLFAVALASWALIAARARKQELETERSDWLMPIALVWAFGIAATGSAGWEEAIAWSFTAALLGLAAWWMWRGCQESRAGVTILGSVLLGALVIARYFDLFQSLASRGLAFILLGLVFIAEAFYYRRLRRAGGGAQ